MLDSIEVNQFVFLEGKFFKEPTVLQSDEGSQFVVDQEKLA